MNYWKMTDMLSELSIDTYNFKEFVMFRHKQTLKEVHVTRKDMPRKRATPEQCEKVFNLVKDQLLNNLNDSGVLGCSQ